MDPTLDSQIGIYTVVLTFTPNGVTANNLVTSFLVHVYPATEYQSVNTTT